MNLLVENLTSPMVGCFLLGMIATWVRSDLKLPDALYQALSIYLLLSIGLKGGVALSATPVQLVVLPVAATLVLGVLTPLVMFFYARYVARIDRTNSAALAAHYGSVSAVTFIAALGFADLNGASYEGFLPALVAVLEIPSIVIGIFIARPNRDTTSIKEGLHEVFSGKSILLLAGGVLIGILTGKGGYEQVKPFFTDGFRGALCLFLLDMGLIASRRLKEMETGIGLLALAGIIVPVINGALGVLAGSLAGMSEGGAAILGTMAASASYIAAPAAIRAALPEANPGMYLTASLGITFPFNLAAGIPLYFWMAQHLI